MLSKDKRLNLTKEFKWVAAGKKYQSANFKLFFRLGENQIPRVGVALSKRQFKKAHERNAAKRIGFKLSEKIYDRLPNSQNLVIMPNANILSFSPEALEQEINDVKDLYNIN